MNRTGLRFKVVGEYVTDVDYDCSEDPDAQEWHQFETRDLHPGEDDSFTLWTQFSELTDGDRQELINRAITIVDWMRGEKHWEGFIAKLILASTGETVFQWELC